MTDPIIKKINSLAGMKNEAIVRTTLPSLTSYTGINTPQGTFFLELHSTEDNLPDSSVFQSGKESINFRVIDIFTPKLSGAPTELPDFRTKILKTDLLLANGCLFQYQKHLGWINHIMVDPQVRGSYNYRLLQALMTTIKSSAKSPITVQLVKNNLVFGGGAGFLILVPNSLPNKAAMSLATKWVDSPGGFMLDNKNTCYLESVESSKLEGFYELEVKQYGY